MYFKKSQTFKILIRQFSVFLFIKKPKALKISLKCQNLVQINLHNSVQQSEKFLNPSNYPQNDFKASLNEASTQKSFLPFTAFIKYHYFPKISFSTGEKWAQTKKKSCRSLNTHSIAPIIFPSDLRFLYSRFFFSLRFLILLSRIKTIF